jgi:hypothetical protein
MRFSLAQGAEIQAGVAQVDITPPIGGNTVGYAGAQPTDGIHDDVSARILVLESGETSVAIVVCDLCVFNSPLLHEQISALGIDRLLLLNTHTHAGPDLRQMDFPSADQPWRQTVERKILEGVKQARQDLFPAYFAAAEGGIQLGYNRLVRQGLFAVTHFENPDRIPYGPVDPTVGVIRITDVQQAVRVVLVHYACHPVVLGPRNRKISADYPGVVRSLVEEALGDDAMCIFVQGAGGDINPLIMARGENRDHDFEHVDRMGQLLANEVLEIVEEMRDKPGRSDELLSASSIVTLGHRFQPDETIELGVTTLLVNGNIGVVTMPGEPFHQFQVDLRRKAGLKHAFLFGYCCDGPYDWPRYLPDLVSAARGGYGASDTTRAEVGSGEQLLNRGLAQLFKLQGRLKSSPQRHTFE